MIKDIHQKEELHSQILSEDQLSTQKMNPINFHNNIWAYKDTIVRVLTGDHYYPEKEIVLHIKRYVLSIKKEEEALKAEVFAREGLEKDKGKRRERIPEDVIFFVWRRDEGRCKECGSNKNLELDHIIPISKGGSNTARNIQLLCEICNRLKSDNI
ncbi:HNH endonuclease [Nitrospinae bacterium AH_259_B05_G02_I21]|nr:HNH endonuclease [Nitrospinae bacterium AH_259_B05_G02_I21]